MLMIFRENGSFRNGNSLAQYFSPTTGTKVLCVKSSNSLANMPQRKTP